MFKIIHEYPWAMINEYSVHNEGEGMTILQQKRDAAIEDGPCSKIIRNELGAYFRTSDGTIYRLVRC